MLEKLTAQQQDMIVALPYRAGLWLSRADQEGGPEFHPLELKALEEVLAHAAQKGDDQFIGFVAHATMDSKTRWGAWTHNLDDVLSDCRQALSVLYGHIDDDSLRDYRRFVMSVAAVVAGAHGEFSDPGTEDYCGAFGRFMNKLHESVVGAAPTGNANFVSPAEDAALEQLAEALHLRRAA